MRPTLNNTFWWNQGRFELFAYAFWRLCLCKIRATFILATKMCFWVGIFWEFAVHETNLYQINDVYAFWAPF